MIAPIAESEKSLIAELSHLRLVVEARDRRIGELLVMNARLEKVAGVGRHKKDTTSEATT